WRQYPPSAPPEHRCAMHGQLPLKGEVTLFLLLHVELEEAVAALYGEQPCVIGCEAAAQLRDAADAVAVQLTDDVSGLQAETRRLRAALDAGHHDALCH